MGINPHDWRQGSRQPALSAHQLKLSRPSHRRTRYRITGSRLRTPIKLLYLQEIPSDHLTYRSLIRAAIRRQSHPIPNHKLDLPLPILPPRPNMRSLRSGILLQQSLLRRLRRASAFMCAETFWLKTWKRLRFEIPSPRVWSLSLYLGFIHASLPCIAEQVFCNSSGIPKCCVLFFGFGVSRVIISVRQAGRQALASRDRSNDSHDVRTDG